MSWMTANILMYTATIGVEPCQLIRDFYRQDQIAAEICLARILFDFTDLTFFTLFSPLIARVVIDSLTLRTCSFISLFTGVL